MINILSQEEILSVLSANLKIWNENYGVKSIALFGSYACEKHNHSSDIDLLVEFEDKAMTFDNYMELKFELEDHFKKPIDLIIIEDLKPELKPKILKNAKYPESDDVFS